MVISKTEFPLRSPTVPKAIPTVHVLSAQPLVICQHLLRRRVRGQVEVAGLLAEEDVPDRAADQRELVAVAREQAADLGRGGHSLTQQRGGRLPLFIAHGHGHREYRQRGFGANRQ